MGSVSTKREQKSFFYNVARNATMELILSPLIALIQSKIHVMNNGNMAGDAKMTIAKVELG